MFGASIVAFTLLAMASEDTEKIKASAFGICAFRTTLSLLPDEAEALCYDKRTPKFEGVALEFNPDKSAHGGTLTMDGCQKFAADFPSLLKRMSGDGKKAWGGLDFNVCRAHTVDDLIIQAVAEESPIRQIIFCGVGQDYRSMRPLRRGHSRSRYQDL